MTVGDAPRSTKLNFGSEPGLLLRSLAGREYLRVLGDMVFGVGPWVIMDAGLERFESRERLANDMVVDIGWRRREAW